MSLGELDARTPEETFGEQLYAYAHVHGWLGYHPRTSWDARTKRWRTVMAGDKGFLDWIFVHEEREEAIVAELKSRKGSLSEEQKCWLAAWERIAARSNGAIRVFLWRPENRDAAYAVLDGGQP